MRKIAKKILKIIGLLLELIGIKKSILLNFYKIIEVKIKKISSYFITIYLLITTKIGVLKKDSLVKLIILLKTGRLSELQFNEILKTYYHLSTLKDWFNLILINTKLSVKYLIRIFFKKAWKN